MANYEESREMERSCDAQTASDDYAVQLAAVVFELRLARTRAAVPPAREPSAPSELWMSRNTRRTDAS